MNQQDLPIEALKEGAAGASRRRVISGALILIGIMIGVYLPILYFMVLHWRMVDDYSHGFLIAPLAIYFAYEHFLIRTMKQVGGHESLRTNRNRLATELKAFFGKVHCKAVWNNKVRRLAEMKRDAVVHNGNRLTTALQGCKKDLTPSR